MKTLASIQHEPQNAGEFLITETMHLVRWGIPGTVFFGIIFFLSTIVRIPPFPSPPLFHTIQAHGYLEKEALIGTVALLIGASVPIGFIIYQVYYVWFWFGWPQSRRNPERLLRPGGFQKLISYYLQKYQLQTIMDNEEQYVRTKFIRGKGLKNVHKRHYDWIILSTLVGQGANKATLTELARWDDIFHGLGATCTAVILGSLLFLLLWILPSPFARNINQQGERIELHLSSSNSNHNLADSLGNYHPIKASVDSVSHQYSSDTSTLSSFEEKAISGNVSLAQWSQMFLLSFVTVIVFSSIFRINRNAIIRQMSITTKMALMQLDKTDWPQDLRDEFTSPNTKKASSGA